MEITEISVSIRNDYKLKAFVNVTFDAQFVIRGMKVIQGSDKLFVSMPSRRMPNGTFKDIAHPINSDFRDMLEKRILMEYHRVTGQP